MKHNKIKISVRLINEDDVDDPQRDITIFQELELPIASQDDPGYGQLSCALKTFRRHMFRQLERIGVIEKRVDEGALHRAVMDEVLEEVSAIIRVPSHMLKGQPRSVYDPDMQSMLTCSVCLGSGIIHRNVDGTIATPASDINCVNLMNSVCPACSGLGKVGR